MKCLHLYILALVTVLLPACDKQGPQAPAEKGIRSIAEVKPVSEFVMRAGFDPARSAIVTNERRMTGIVLVEFGNNGETRHYRHPSWTDAGRLGPIVVDEAGNVYVAPVPMINLLQNDPAEQNKIYKLNHLTGEMKLYLELPQRSGQEPANPFGVMGLAYDYESKLLYVTSLAGSTENEERGTLYCIQTQESPEILDSISGIDAIGIGISYMNGHKTLFLGHARSGRVFSLPLNERGGFTTGLKEELSLAGIGPKGDDRAFKIRFSKQGEMLIKGAPFYYNLAPHEEEDYITYSFRYDPGSSKWEEVLVGTGN